MLNLQNGRFMIDKKEFLLQSIIKAYIEHLEPIGSTQLKSMYDITYSPATIRGYFKKLGDEGYLAQEHISSGRTPTNEALKQYWKSKLNFKIDGVNLRALEYYASKIGLSVFIKKEKTDILKNIINVENRYMILEFSSFAISVRYSEALYRFLVDLIDLHIKDILKISKDVGAFEVYNSINQ
ncbi:heat-shock protein, partial [Aliarcobacter butzleri]